MWRTGGKANEAWEQTNNSKSAVDGVRVMPAKSRLLTTTESHRKESSWAPALHPGEMLREEFMKPLGLSANALAIALRVPVTRISEIVRERRGITADTALRLARYFNMTPEFWMRLQMNYDLESASNAEQVAMREEIRPRPDFRRRTESAGRNRAIPA